MKNFIKKLLNNDNLVSNPPAYEQTIRSQERQVETEIIRINENIKNAINDGKFYIVLGHSYTISGVDVSLKETTQKAIEVFLKRGFRLVEIKSKYKCLTNVDEINKIREQNQLLIQKGKKRLKKEPAKVYEEREYVKDIRLSWEK